MKNTAPYTIHWWLVRHAPVVNPNDIAYGSMDLDSSFVGMEARTGFLRATLPTGPQCQVRTSMLKRSQQTLKNIWPQMDIVPDGAWNEQSLGIWEGQPRAEIYAPQGPIRALFQDPVHFRPPTAKDGHIGENWTDLLGRVAASMEKAETDSFSRHEIVFCHAGTIRAAIAHALSLDPERAFSFQIAPMSLTRLDSVHFLDEGYIHRRWRVGGINLGPGDHEL